MCFYIFHGVPNKCLYSGGQCVRGDVYRCSFHIFQLGSRRSVGFVAALLLLSEFMSLNEYELCQEREVAIYLPRKVSASAGKWDPVRNYKFGNDLTSKPFVNVFEKDRDNLHKLL